MPDAKHTSIIKTILGWATFVLVVFTLPPLVEIYWDWWDRIITKWGLR